MTAPLDELDPRDDTHAAAADAVARPASAAAIRGARRLSAADLAADALERELDESAFDALEAYDDSDHPADDEPTAGSLDLADRAALRRVQGLSTELTDVTEVEYRQIRLERVVLVGVWTEGTV